MKISNGATKILFAASECAPFAKVGGLADIIGSLPKALKKIGLDVSVIIPFYGIIPKQKRDKFVLKEEVFFNGEKRKFKIRQRFLAESRVPLFLIEEKEFFKNGVYVEADASSGGSQTEAGRFLFFSRAALKFAEIKNFNILHCHDWHTAIIPFLIKKQGLPIKTLLTIHNMAYQGIYPAEIVNRLLGTDFSKAVNCLKQGILSADFINTVSENYAREILSPEFGFGLEKVLKKRKENLTGVLNGLDQNQFNPKNDPFIKTNYSSRTLNKKAENKTFLQKKFFQGTCPEIPLLGIVSRLAPQKGFDLIKKIFNKLMKERVQFILLGLGSKEYEDFFRKKSQQYPKKFFAEFSFNEKLAHQIYAGSDLFLMPSFFEPCGLGQMISMRYATLPLVRAIGGLKDTVVPYEQKNGTGFLFGKYDGQELLTTIKTALRVYQNKNLWKKLQQNAMRKDFSWQTSAKKYLEIYQNLKNP